MEIQVLRKLLRDYRRVMVEARTKGDMELHKTCVALTRELTEQIKEKTVCSQQTAYQTKYTKFHFTGT